ncbi:MULTISPECIES: hypothetical protein [Streptomyces]|uniref:hypothetical protein n=1 Tax=Streptomyces TaxID=1883 RepID=UPI001E355F5E|nr:MULTISPECIES: hypothetical protein [Streptomyces]UFQ14354.1 hypothetical protein J2N69_04585 [Streptomyces huasconensis]WCL83954.1 hypothetical protein PPN52_04575 [Streptomyces sp. JCM 35825]
MWPGQQPPGGEQNPRDQSQNPYRQPGYQAPNPYQQPGYQAPNPYQQPVAAPQGQPQGGGGKGTGRVKVVSVVMAAAVVVAAGVTGFLVLGGDKDDRDEKDTRAGSPSQAAPASPGAAPDDGDDSERGTDNGLKPTIKGWHVVVNPRWGTAFDVPPEWEVQNPGSAIAYEDNETGKPLMTMSAPAYLKPTWCVTDDDKDGRSEDHELAAVGTKGAKGAKNTDQVAVNQVAWWVYAAYTQPDKKSFTSDEKAQPYTTASGIKGSIARAESRNTPQRGKCASDGKAITFGFKNAAGDYVAWSLYGARGVKDEISEETVMKILSTVRTHGEATES